MPPFSNRIKLIASICFLAIAYFIHFKQTVHQPTGVLVTKTPVQVNFEKLPPSFKFKKYRISPLAEYEIQARVLSVRTYWWDQMSDFSPIDFAVGWNRMSDSNNINQLDISQGNRFYFYNWSRTPPIPVDEIISSSANMHLLPADSNVKSALMKVRPGQIITLKGQLIEATGENGSRFRSSLTRTDTGFGACEIMWVTQITSP